MIPVAANLDSSLQRASEPTQTASLERHATDLDSAHSGAFGDDPSEAVESPNAARLFLDRVGIVQRMAPIRILNAEMRQEHPQFDEIYRVVEENPEILKRFLKFANGAWFNSRVQVDSPMMAFSRFGTQGFYRLVLATFLQENIGELSTKFRIWPHLEWAARAGEMMAQQLAPNLADDVFSAALLHDAIVPPMERELEDYLYFLECALNTDPVVTSLESRCHEFDHAQAAAELASTLDFEPHVIEAIGAHHLESMANVSSPEARAVLGLLLATKRAIVVARTQGKNTFESASERNLLREIATALEVSTGRVVNSVGDVADMLHLPA